MAIEINGRAPLARPEYSKNDLAEIFKNQNPPKVEKEKKSRGLDNEENMMKLFLAQLETQNPMDQAQDPTKMIAQLAQMSQVEQASKTNEKLDTLISIGRSGKLMDSDKLLDKSVMFPTDKLKLSNCQPEFVENKDNLSFDKIKGKIELPTIPVAKGQGHKQYSEVVLRVMAPNGKDVATLHLGKQANGATVPFEFDKLEGVALQHLDEVQKAKVLAGELKIKAQGVMNGKYIDAKTSVGNKISAVGLQGNDYVVSSESSEKIVVKDLNEIW